MSGEPHFWGFHDGFEVYVDNGLGHLWVEHDGSITWDQLQEIKNQVWGESLRAIEVYPTQAQTVNTRPCRHLWRLGALDFAPDLLGDVGSQVGFDTARDADSLQSRFCAAWAEAWEVAQ